MIARFFAAAFLALTVVPAYAADKADLPPLTPKGQFLVMTPDDATSSSKCIGNPITPLCAAETMMAVRVRSKQDYRRIALGLDGGPLFSELDSAGHTEIYRIIRSEILTDKRFPWPPKRNVQWRHNGLYMQAGDIRIDIISTPCGDEISLSACGHVWFEPSAYIVRRQGDRWIVITAGKPYNLRK